MGLVKTLKAGLSKTNPSATKQMKKADGSYCSTSEENAEVFRQHFQQLYNRPENFDETVLDSLPQMDIVQGCDHTPTNEEIRTATLKLKNTAPGESGIRPEIWKTLLENSTTEKYLQTVIKQIWVTEIIPDEWNTGKLTILPKKGDLGFPKNYRGIMLLEVAYKIIVIIMHSRLLPIQEGLDHEPQCGFRPERGCTDAIYTVKIALKKRREHGKESWVFFLDLVKAFDRVPRELLWEILKRFGVPNKLISLLKTLHNNFEVKFTADENTHTIPCTIGVKQGDILAPILFTFFLAAVIITWRVTTNIPLCIFRTENDAKMTGRSYRAYGEEFALNDSEYADDTALVFGSRSDCVTGIPLCMKHFARFGMEVHSGPIEPRESSKSVVLFCSKPSSMYEDPSTFDNTDLSEISFNDRYIPIVDEFTYLGSVITRDLSDEMDVDRRIQKAGNAFGMMRKCLFSSPVVKLKVKANVFRTFILPILLYGVECWSLTVKLLTHLRSFYRRCIRTICRASLRDRLRTTELLDRLSLESIDTYVCRQQLRWAGHVIRMPWSRLPRKILSCWVRSKRPRGAPKFTYGRSLMNCLKKANIDRERWHLLACDRHSWRNRIRSLKI